MGGTKDFKIQRIALAAPDIIIANVDENRRDDVERLEKVFHDGKVFVTHPNTFDEAVHMIRDLGALFGLSENAEAIATELLDLRKRLSTLPKRRVLYMIWMKPFMTAAPGTFIHDMLEQTGHVNCVSREFLSTKTFESPGKARYPELTIEEIIALSPDAIYLSSEPYPFKEKHVRYLRRQLSKVDKTFTEKLSIELVDGEVYSWYGSRMLHAMRAIAGADTE